MITIIVLLILAGITISALSGDNGILTNATKAKEQTEISNEKDAVNLAVGGALAEDEGNSITYDNLVKEFDQNPGSGKYTLDGSGPFTVTFTESGRAYEIDENGKISEVETGPVEQPEETPEFWEATRPTDSQWYNYVDVTSNTSVKVNSPKLTGGMTPIKYVGPESETQTGSKWANAMTSDGSMFVWIPRYAYKITSGYHSSEAGTIEIKFLNGTTNEFIDGSGTAETDPNKITYTGDIQNEWLVHPAFTGNAENGGWKSELAGIWIGKFETSNNISNLTVKPTKYPITSVTVNQMYLAGKSATFGEKDSNSIGSHMMKNSEWGAMIYLTYSKYGINSADVEKAGYFSLEEIYTKLKKQSSTGNAYGIYSIVGGNIEIPASYVYFSDNDLLTNYGGTNSGDLFGSIEEQHRSTEYKTVYKNYYSSSMKGDLTYEITTGSTGDFWGKYSYQFPWKNYPFFGYGRNYNGSEADLFFSSCEKGAPDEECSFRMILSF